jgi:hypothetical protein
MTFVKFVFLLLMICFSSCLATKPVNVNNICLPNSPKWKVYYETDALRDIYIRTDSIKFKGTIWNNLADRKILFQRYELFTEMNVEQSGSTISNPDRVPFYQNRQVQIDLYVSDTLEDSIIDELRSHDTNIDIEKGYFGHKRFLYINDYDYFRAYFLVNLKNKRAYKLEQNGENSKYCDRCINYFIEKGCRQGIQFIVDSEMFSFGDCLMY